MAQSKSKQEPSFFWQGLLILLPVLILVGFGFFSLRQDRIMAEAEARQRANELADSLLLDIQQEFDFSGPSYAAWNSAIRNLSVDTRKFIAAPGPANSDPVLKFTDTNQPVGGCQVVVLNDKHELVYPPPLADVPAPQSIAADKLNDSQKRLWSEIQSVEFVRHDFGAAAQMWTQLIKTGLPKNLSARFTYEEAVAFNRNNQRSQALDQFLSVAHMDATELSETGVPLRQLAFLNIALLKSASAGSAWSDLCRESIIHPGVMTEFFLDQAFSHVVGEEKESVMAWQRVWNAHQAARGAFAALIQTNDLFSTNNASLPDSFKFLNGSLVSVSKTAEGGTVVLVMPQAEVFSRLEQLLEKRRAVPWDMVFSKISFAKDTRSINTLSNFKITGPVPPLFIREPAAVVIPPYFGVLIHLGDDRIPDSTPRATLRMIHPVLAERNSHSPGIRYANSIRIVNLPFELGMEVYLAEADAFYAQHWQRAWLFGGLIAMCALAALFGFFAARGAFYRQLRLNEMKSNFVSSVSHELRAPIASVRLMAEGLERGKIAGAEKQNEYFKFIVQECRRLSSLIENVLDFSRIEQGRKQYEMESTDLVALTSQTVKLMETYAAERQVKIALEVRGDAVPVEIEGKAIQQALVNLIDNAVKHSPKGSGITVGLDFTSQGNPLNRPSGTFSPSGGEGWDEGVPRNGIVQLWVEDKGEGIPASEHERIFERFYRLGSELRRETQGVGIGLSIVKHIVEAHGGKIIVRSAPGEGSRFTIELLINQMKGAR